METFTVVLVACGGLIVVSLFYPEIRHGLERFGSWLKRRVK